MISAQKGNCMKAVLVIDTDEKNVGRKVNYISVQGDGYSYIVGTMGENVRLRPLPQREKANEGSHGWIGMIDNAWTQGFNDCLAEITGEME